MNYQSTSSGAHPLLPRVRDDETAKVIVILSLGPEGDATVVLTV